MNETMNMPVLALRGLAIFPGCVLSFDVEREISIRALEKAMERDQYIFLVAQRETGTDQPAEKDLYAVGTMSVIRQILRIGDAAVRVPQLRVIHPAAHAEVFVHLTHLKSLLFLR